MELSRAGQPVYSAGRTRERGFSVVEALVAAAIILVIASGVLPMFTRAMVNNVAGNESTLPLFIWSQLRFPNKLPGVLALGSCILVLSFVIVVLAEWVRRRGVQSGQPTAF